MLHTKEQLTKKGFQMGTFLEERTLGHVNCLLSTKHAHNAFADPLITPTIGTLDWTIQEIKDIDTRTRKILSVTGNFHPNSDVDRLYIGRNTDGRDLKSCQRLFESRIIAKQQLHHNKERNQILKFVYNEERNNIMRVGDELLQKCDLNAQTEEQHRITSKRFTKVDINFHHKKFSSKVMHGYFKRIIEKENIEIIKPVNHGPKPENWHFEGYIAAIQEQEIPTKYLINKKAQDAEKEPPYDNKCRLCKTDVEFVIQVVVFLCLHDIIYQWNMIWLQKPCMKKIKKKQKQKHPEIEAPKEINEQEYIQKIGDNE